MKNLNEIFKAGIAHLAEQEPKENCEVLIVKRADVEKVMAQIKCDLERADSLIFGIPYIAITTQAAGLNLALKILHLDGEPNG
jgi:hypothetical protein